MTDPATGLPADLFDYPLPADRIAQAPLPERDSSRLLVHDRRSGTTTHATFRDLPAFLSKGDTLIRNRARVLPARLLASRPSGGSVECLLVRPTADAPRTTWWCLLRPGRKLPPGTTFGIPGAFSASVLERDDEGLARVSFSTPDDADAATVAHRHGQPPLPPYIERSATDARLPDDRVRYQTVYADPGRAVAAAAPTAGLHFTQALLDQLAAAGIDAHDITLHVGLGTFRPITTADVRDHAMHAEVYQVPGHVLARLRAPPPAGRRIAVGTTSLRACEDALRTTPPDAPPHDLLGETRLFIYPPASFAAADALITNFHQPRSTLLCLVAAFLAPGSTDGIARLHTLYREALDRGYRFLSYGDAMLIL